MSTVTLTTKCHQCFENDVEFKVTHGETEFTVPQCGCAPSAFVGITFPMSYLTQIEAS